MRIRCACALLTASGFSIITCTRCAAASSTICGMIVSIGESRHGFRLRRRDHRAGIGEEHRLRQLVSFGILPEERRVGVEYADYLDVLARLRGLQEPADMSMHEAGDRQTQWRLRSLLIT